MTQKTLTNRKIIGNWDLKKATKAISMDELVNKWQKRVDYLLSQDFVPDNSLKKEERILRAEKTKTQQ